MPELLHTAFGVLAKIAILLMMLALGLNSARFQPGHLLRRPSLFARSLLTVDVLLPLFALGLAVALPLPPAVKVALVLLAISPGAPFAPLRSVKVGGDVVYTYSLFVALALLALLTVPLTLLLLSELFDASWRVEIRALARLVFLAQVVPLVLGFAIQRTAPVFAAKVGPALAKVANLTILLLALLFLLTHIGALADLGPWSYAALALLACAAILLGHALGGPSRGTRMSLSVMGAIRNPALVVLIAHVNFPTVDVLGPILAYLIVASIAVTVYGRLSRSLPEGRSPRGMLRPSLGHRPQSGAHA